MQLTMKQTVFALLFVALSATTLASYQEELAEWRKETEEELKVDEGWLTLAGLYWLKEGKNSFGAEKGNDLVLPTGSAPAKVGIFELHDGAITLTVAGDVSVTSDGRPVQAIEMKPEAEPPTKIKVGSLTLTIIKRGNRNGVRFWDTNNPRRRDFKGLRWFPRSDEFRVRAKFVPHSTATELAVPNVLGDVLKMPSPGTLFFELKGKEYSLEPVTEEDGKLFIIFSDSTNGKQTYSAGRFLSADAPVNGEVLLDFNKATNPPCALTHFATCPLPPEQNHLAVAIEAGETFTEQAH